jgi:hypothetical protein
MKKRVLSAVLLTIFTAAAFAQSGQDNLNIYVPGETFVYSVKWTFIRVGTIALRKTISLPITICYPKSGLPCICSFVKYSLTAKAVFLT